MNGCHARKDQNVLLEKHHEKRDGPTMARCSLNWDMNAGKEYALGIQRWVVESQGVLKSTDLFSILTIVGTQVMQQSTKYLNLYFNPVNSLPISEQFWHHLSPLVYMTISDNWKNERLVPNNVKNVHREKQKLN